MHLYKLFQYLMMVEGPFSQAWIQKKKEPWELYAGAGTKNDLLNLPTWPTKMKLVDSPPPLSR